MAKDQTKVDFRAEGRNKINQYLTTAEVAQRYRTAESTVRYWRSQNPIYGPRGVRVGRRVLYSLAECERFEQQLAEQGHTGGAPAA